MISSDGSVLAFVNFSSHESLVQVDAKKTSSKLLSYLHSWFLEMIPTVKMEVCLWK